MAAVCAAGPLPIMQTLVLRVLRSSMAEASFGAVDVEAEDDEGDEERHAAAATPTALQALLSRLSTSCGFEQNLISKKRHVVLRPSQ